MYNNYPSTGTTKVCTVTAVDLRRAVCKCVSDLGEILADVRWLLPAGGLDGNGSSYAPVENSKALVDISSGFPFIIGYIPSECTDDVRRQNIGRQDVDEEDIADYTTISTGELIRGPGTPRDQRPGDLINTGEGGAVQGVLNAGTVINKASPLAQVLCSRFGDMVRVVSRNYEHFSDVEQEQKVSIRGSLYTRNDLYRDPIKSREEIPNVINYSGNVQVAELVQAIEDEGYEETTGEGEEAETVHKKYTYASIPVESFPATPADDFIVEKTYVYNDEVPEEGSPRVPTYTWTRSIEGEEISLVQTTDETKKIETTKNNERITVQYTDTSGDEETETTFYQDALSFHVDITDTVSVDGNADGLIIHSGIEDDSTLVEIKINADGTLVITTTGDASITVGGNLTADVTGNSTTTVGGDMSADITGNSALTVGGNFTADISGTTDWTSAGAITLTAPTINLNN